MCACLFLNISWRPSFSIGGEDWVWELYNQVHCIFRIVMITDMASCMVLVEFQIDKIQICNWPDQTQVTRRVNSEPR
jgi:hypothetical protein